MCSHGAAKPSGKKQSNAAKKQEAQKPVFKATASSSIKPALALQQQYSSQHTVSKATLLGNQEPQIVRRGNEAVGPMLGFSGDRSILNHVV